MPIKVPINFGICALDKKSIIKVKTKVKTIRGVKFLSQNSKGIKADENKQIIETRITR